MPIYDLKCPACEHIVRDEYVRNVDETVKCVRCGALMKRLVSRIHAHVFPADGIFLENVSAKGKRFYSKKEMREYEKQTGTMIGMLH